MAEVKSKVTKQTSKSTPVETASDRKATEQQPETEQKRVSQKKTYKVRTQLDPMGDAWGRAGHGAAGAEERTECQQSILR